MMSVTDQTVVPGPHAKSQSIIPFPPRGCGRAGGRVLLVEEDADVSELAAMVLSDEGYSVVQAASPEAALDLLARDGRFAVDLVLSAPFAHPIDAPYRWLDRLRWRVHAPIVICTRQPAVFYADHRNRGYAGVLEQPFDLHELIDLVAAHCPAPSGDAQPDAGGNGHVDRAAWSPAGQ